MGHTGNVGYATHDRGVKFYGIGTPQIQLPNAANYADYTGYPAIELQGNVLVERRPYYAGTRFAIEHPRVSDDADGVLFQITAWKPIPFHLVNLTDDYDCCGILNEWANDPFSDVWIFLRDKMYDLGHDVFARQMETYLPQNAFSGFGREDWDKHPGHWKTLLIGLFGDFTHDGRYS